VFIAPSKKPWVGLTDEEIQDLSYLSQKIDESNAAWFDRCGFARAIEAKLKERNE
jgi:N-acetylglutamate synthase-like GNAT family acetyltransferase